MAPYLLVLAHSRSGSTHLLDLLGALSGVASLGEFFSRQPKNQLVKFVEESLEPYGSNAALADAAITNPLETLAFCEQLDGVNLFVVKVLGQHLRDDCTRRILIDNAVGVIVLRRNPFSAWVSRALVDQSKTWENAGTARFAVRFDEALASLERLGLGYLTEDADTDDLEYLLSVLVKKRQPSPFQRLVSVVTQRVRRAPKR